METIMLAPLVLGGLGLGFGLLLSLVSRAFAVRDDPRIETAREALPGANCGACGYPGCDGYARAVVEGASIDLCPVGGEAVARALGALMEIEPVAQQVMAAQVLCRGDGDHCRVRFDYVGPPTCKGAMLAGNGDKACQFACLGYGDCEASCPFGAIQVRDRLAWVEEDKCRGCGACISACPRGVLKMYPIAHKVHRTCSALERGKVVLDNCTAGCMGCGKCARSCKFGALTMVNNLPLIQQDKCVGCMECADHCPTGALRSNERFRRHALIRYDLCKGCGLCQEACQFDAIRGEGDQKRSTIDWNCVGCGACAQACPIHCIEMVPGPKYKK